MKMFVAAKNNVEGSHVKSLEEYEIIHQAVLADPVSFWLNFAERFYWKRMPSREKALSYNFDVREGPISIRWFADGETNVCYNALDVHIENGFGQKVAFYWEGNDPNDTCTLTYEQLFLEVSRFGNALRSLGVSKGDCVAIYMPFIPELVIAVLACCRLGAVHSVIFGGFSAESLAGRILDARCTLLITCDGTWRGSKLVDLKSKASQALDQCSHAGHPVSTCIVVKHVTAWPAYRKPGAAGQQGKCEQAGVRPALQLSVEMTPGRDVWWDELMEQQERDCPCPVQWMNAEDTLFILYTSGSTGKPKGVVHTVGGYMLYTACTFLYVFAFDRDSDVYWCTADPGWITGHSYVIYGPLLNGATGVIFEGIPTWPDAGRFWSIVDRYQVTKFYTAPTAIRCLMGAGDHFVTKYKRTSLKVLGSVGEPINPTAWEWYYQVVGNGHCSVVDTYWQTETGGHIITPLPGAHVMKPGSASRPFPGIQVGIFSDAGEDLMPRGSNTPAKGHLVVRRPWPGMLRTLYGNQELFEQVYFRKFPGTFVTGDGAMVDEDGDFWITGRIDDMINMSGHLISTSEVENVLVSHPAVSEAAGVGRPHPVKGQCLHCFITLKADYCHLHKSSAEQGSVCGRNYCQSGGGLDDRLRAELVQLVRTRIGEFVQLDHVQEAPVLPKTRSGKILRRLLRQIAMQDDNFGDISTLADPSCLSSLIEGAKRI